MSNKAPRLIQPYVPGRNAAAAASPKASRTVVRWWGGVRLFFSWVTSRRASRASQGRVAARAAGGRICDSGMIGPFYARFQAHPKQLTLPKDVSGELPLGAKPADRILQRL